MSKLELKHVLPHLPFGLRFHLPLDSERYESIMENEPFRLALPFMDEIEKTKHFAKYQKMYLCQENPQIMWDDNRLFLGQMKSNLGFEEDDVYLDEVKPILRPLSEFEYDHIIQLKEHLGLGKWCDNYDHYFDAWFDDAENVQELALQCPYVIMQFFLESHFDIFNLIPQGLAIDINDVKENEL